MPPAPYFNRELSWLDFNDRVLQLAEDVDVPLLERCKFAAIYTSNLDEFFMVRVAGLHDQIAAGVDDRGPAGFTSSETLAEIRERVIALERRLARCLERSLSPALAEHGIRLVSRAQLDERERRQAEDRFRRQIFPVLTPLGVGPGRPFPYISNLSLSLAVLVRDPIAEHTTIARVKVPKEVLSRFITLDDGMTLMPIEELIAAHIEDLFGGMEVIGHGFFRVTRDADFTVSDEADDLLAAVEDQLRRRRFGEVVRLEVDSGMPGELRERIADELDAEPVDVYTASGMLDMGDLWQLVELPGYRELRDPPWTPVTPAWLQEADTGSGADVFAAMRAGDRLVHHPYDSFRTSVERFVEQAVEDPDVLAIKQTVYRTSDDSALMPALIKAAEQGKQAVCLVEVKARFDEEANIEWARELERAGAHVTYGLPGLKTHAKAILVVRREGEGVRRYMHIATGNYNAVTAGLYTDFGLFTVDEQLGADVAELFNYLTGFSRPADYRKLLVAPSALRDGIIAEIEAAVASHDDRAPARIAMKMNSLVDERCIDALYAASQAGVRIDLNVRGICCLRPGVEGLSENIRVVSVVGRLLEHSRIYAFEHGGGSDVKRVYIGSADLMPRNLDARVETLAPVSAAALRDELLDTIARALADDENAWDLGADGAWRRRARRAPVGEGDGAVHSLQRELMRIHTAAAEATHEHALATDGHATPERDTAPL